MEKEIKELTVRDILDKGDRGQPSTVSIDATLRDAIDAMIANPTTRKVYVIDGNGKLVGTVTLETLMRFAGYSFGVRKTGITSFLKMLGEISQNKVTEAMSRPVRIIEDEMLVNVTKMMVENHLNDLPVVDANDKLVGELNGLDILKESRKHWE